MPNEANTEYFDAAVRHAVAVRRFTGGEVKRILTLLEKVDADVVRKIRRALPNAGKSWTTVRFKALLDRIGELRAAALQAAAGETRTGLLDFAKVEADFERRLLEAAIPIEIDLVGVQMEKLRKVVTAEPLRGRFLRDWFKDLARDDKRRVTDAIRMGMVEGEAVPAVARRLAGTRAAGFSDGVLAVTRRNAETIVRTAINHVSNRAREEVWAANDDVILGYQWVSTLDGRTSAICRARDGHVAAAPGRELPAGMTALKPANARPPAHPNCRSLLVAIIDAEGVVGNRPYVTDTRTRARREVDFRAMAKESGRPIQDVRREWTEQAVGRLPAKVSYNEWLRRQSAAFQDEVLGAAKGKLYRKGGLQLDSFVDRRGNELTLSQLAAREPDAFARAGLNPEDFAK